MTAVAVRLGDLLVESVSFALHYQYGPQHIDLAVGLDIALVALRDQLGLAHLLQRLERGWVQPLGDRVAHISRFCDLHRSRRRRSSEAPPREEKKACNRERGGYRLEELNEIHDCEQPWFEPYAAVVLDSPGHPVTRV